MTRRALLLLCGVIASAGMIAAQTAIEEADNFALLRNWVQPQYPKEARDSKLEGEVTVDFIVDAEGRVGDVSVHKSTDARLDDAALAAVKQWTFTPAP